MLTLHNPLVMGVLKDVESIFILKTTISSFEITILAKIV
jgi:hypothetical protein